jgi:hypothetical protein
MIGSEPKQPGAFVQTRADMTTETYLRDVAEKARARFAAADYAMRRLAAATPSLFDQRVTSNP